MKKWTKEVEINAPIGQVWKLVNGSLEDMQKVMPDLISKEPIEKTKEVIGSIYTQEHRSEKGIQSYRAEVIEYENHLDYKKLKERYNLGNLFEMTVLYELKKVDKSHTYFRYTSTNRPLKWILKLMLLFANDKMVVQFTNRVKEVAEEKYKNRRN